MHILNSTICRFERIWDDEVSRYGKEKSSVVRAVYKLIRPRFFVAAFLIIFLSLYAVIGPVSDFQLSGVNSIL